MNPYPARYQAYKDGRAVLKPKSWTEMIEANQLFKGLTWRLVKNER